MKVWLLAVLFSSATLALSARAAINAYASATEARLRLSSLTGEARAVVLLRQQDVLLPKRQQGGIAGRVAATLARCGLPASVLQSIAPESEISEAGSTHMAVRQRANLTLSGLSLPQAGAFLDAWRRDEPDWSIASIDISPVERGGSPQGAAPSGGLGSDLPLRVVVGFEGLFRDSPSTGVKP